VSEKEHSSIEKLAVTVDCVVFGLDDGDLKVLLIRRLLPPFKGSWALPGGFVRLDEGLEEAAERELREEAGLRRVYMEQLYTFGQPGRDPRQRVVSVAYSALVNLSEHPPHAASDAEDAAWFPVAELPTLAFDHAGIVDTALLRLRNKIRWMPIGFELLPEKFTLTQLQRLYEKVLEAGLDKRNFRKKIEKLDVLEELDEYQKDVAHRAARLYRFNEKKYKALARQGLQFEL
jgi:8-oxo-dGTP diphosphatase